MLSGFPQPRSAELWRLDTCSCSPQRNLHLMPSKGERDRTWIWNLIKLEALFRYLTKESKTKQIRDRCDSMSRSEWQMFQNAHQYCGFSSRGGERHPFHNDDKEILPWWFWPSWRCCWPPPWQTGQSASWRLGWLSWKKPDGRHCRGPRCA